MPLSLKPDIKVDKIELEIDKKLTEKVSEGILYEIGRNIPIIKIQDYIIDLGSLLKFSLKVSLNSLPKFYITLNDDNYIIREKLKSEIDKCTIFLGFNEWFLLFTGIIDKVNSNYGATEIKLCGTLYNEKLYNGEQFAYVDKSISDIITDICKKTSMGLYLNNNLELNKTLDYCLITGDRYIDFFDSVIKNYTTNLYSIDTNYFFHVANIEMLRKMPVDFYTLNWSTGKKLIMPSMLNFKSRIKSNVYDEKIPDLENNKIPIDYYTINSNFSEIFKEVYNTYFLGIGGEELKSGFGGIAPDPLKTDSKIGIGSNSTNTFGPFKTHKIPYYEDRINKQIGGNLIKIYTSNVIFELLPFNVVNIELFLPYRTGDKEKLDEEHSGKKIVIGYTIDYEKPLSKNPIQNKLTQTIDLI